MKENRIHPIFHKFLIFFALWVFAALAVFYGAQHIFYVVENGASHKTLDIILSVLLIGVGLFTVLTRFDLAALRERAIQELLWTCLAAAVIFLGLHWVEDISGEDCYQNCVFKAIVFACWGIALYRYYSLKRDQFTKD